MGTGLREHEARPRRAAAAAGSKGPAPFPLRWGKGTARPEAEFTACQSAAGHGGCAGGVGLSDDSV